MTADKDLSKTFKHGAIVGAILSAFSIVLFAIFLFFDGTTLLFLLDFTTYGFFLSLISSSMYIVVKKINQLESKIKLKRVTEW